MRQRRIFSSALLLGALLQGAVHGEAVAQQPSEIRGPARGLAGYWTGWMVHDSASLRVSLAFEGNRRGVWHARFTSLSQRVLEYPLDSIIVTGAEIHLVLGGGSDVFTGQVDGDSIAGVLHDAGAGEGRFLLRRAPEPRYPYRREDIVTTNGTIRIAGSLYLPSGPGRRPAIVILQGSGSETRWGTARYLADRFARAGIAALITDKRGSGESTGDWRTATFDDLADDALASVRLLAGRADIDPRRIGLMGHSQGAMIAPIATARGKSGEVAYIVAGEPLGDSVYKQDLWRVGRIMHEAQASGMHTANEVADALHLYRRFVDVARSGGEGYELFKRACDSVVGQHWFQMLGIPPHDSWIWNWYRSVGNVNPAPYWERVHVPVMVLFGEREEVEPIEENLLGVEHALDRGGNTRYTPVIIPQAQHNWTVHPEPGEPFFWWHQAPGITDLVVAWVVAQTSGERRAIRRSEGVSSSQ